MAKRPALRLSDYRLGILDELYLHGGRPRGGDWCIGRVARPNAIRNLIREGFAVLDGEIVIPSIAGLRLLRAWGRKDQRIGGSRSPAAAAERRLRILEQPLFAGEPTNG